MGLKYDPLGIYLKQQTAQIIELSFDQIDEMLDDPLPDSAKNRYGPQFWSNPLAYSKTRRQWLDAGYDAFFLRGFGARFVRRAGGTPVEAEVTPASSSSIRSVFEAWAARYPDAVRAGDATFAGSEVLKLVTETVPAVVRAAIGSDIEKYRVKGSAGQSQWTHTPWVAVLDLATTSTVQEGLYVVYLLSADGQRLYLTLNQGCTTLYKGVGWGDAAKELQLRAAKVQSKLGKSGRRLKDIEVNLGSKLWRATLYEKGQILGVAYDTRALPDDAELTADLHEALALYDMAQKKGGWAAEDEIIKEAANDGVNTSLDEALKYRQHRSIERQSNHAARVKKLQGTRCKGCDRDMVEVYGEIGKGLIHAHHLTPLSKLAVTAEPVKLDALKDFAVLCPNCHAIIHRMEDVGDVAGLRALVRREWA